MRPLASFVAALAAGAIAAGPAAAADLTLEAETMHLAGAEGGPRPDPDASGGAALLVATDGYAEGEVRTTQPSVHLFVRARGSECFGPPAISVRIDGVERLAAPVSTEGYTELGARLSIPAGVHRVAVALTNDNASALPGLCTRDALIDTVTVVGQPFSAKGWRNARLPAKAPLARNSKALVAELRSQIRAHPQGVGVGTTQYSSPAYVVPRDQPAVRVEGPPHLAEQWSAVPLPADASPAAGTDQHLTVWQPSTDTLWEFWGLARDRSTGTWQARYGGRIEGVSRNEGHFGDPPGPLFGATATSITLLAGMQRVEELRRGAIDHAVDFAVLATRGRDGWCWPAQRTDPDMSSRARGAIPAGARFRLPASLDLKAYARRHRLSRYALTLARAIQRHGMVVRDTTTHPGFYAEDPTPLGHDPYPTIFQGLAPDKHGVFRGFPWKRLQALAPPPGRGCVDDPDADG